MLTEEFARMAKENKPEYYDIRNNPAALTDAEQSYFWETVAKVLLTVGISIPVYMADHEQLPQSCADALGIHWKNDDGDEFISIDCYFIHDCYEVAFNGAHNVFDESLVSVLCHELAHVRYRRHSKYHTSLTAKYISQVMM